MPGTLTVSQQAMLPDVNSGVITLNQFNPALGTLTAVNVDISTPLRGTLGVVDLNDQGSQLIGFASVSEDSFSFDAGAFDGTIDYAGSSGTLVAQISFWSHSRRPWAPMTVRRANPAGLPAIARPEKAVA